jgi:hypothetical protein
LHLISFPVCNTGVEGKEKRSFAKTGSGQTQGNSSLRSFEHILWVGFPQREVINIGFANNGVEELSVAALLVDVKVWRKTHTHAVSSFRDCLIYLNSDDSLRQARDKHEEVQVDSKAKPRFFHM